MTVGRLLSIVVATLCSVAALADLKVEQVRDPHYGHALFEFYKEDYFAAIVELLAADTMERMPNHEDDGELLLGGLYLSYGMHDDAATIFDRLLAERTDEAVRDRTWFFIGKIRYQRGYPETALAALTSIQGELPEELEPERRMMHSQVLMQLGRYDDAAAVLDRWKGPDDWYHFASYNLGVALIRSGDIAAGAARLEDIGSRRGSDREELFSLQDKANVALGYAYLQNDRPLEAKSVLQRVRLDGPFSNKALLGVGWADAELENYRRALVPWLELRGRDLLDSAVQESLLAVPYAYGKLAANSEAASQYLLAIESYVDETRRLDDAIGRIESGELVDELLSLDPGRDVGWFWQLDEVPDSYESRYLYHLLAGHEFQEALKNFRDLRSLQGNLTAWRDNADVFDSMLDTREQAFAARLPAALALLERADMDALQARRDALSGRLDAIETSGDTVALAPEAAVELWQEVDGYRSAPGL
ncbi:MAG: tetratricopeptide repeat protein, partial [Pseudomonadota bacterium]